MAPPDDLGIEIPRRPSESPALGDGWRDARHDRHHAVHRRSAAVPAMLMMPLMMIMGTVGFMAGGGPGGKKIPEIDEDRKEYLRYLGNIRSRVTDSANAQVAFFAYHAPHPDDLLSPSVPPDSGHDRPTPSSMRPPGSESGRSPRSTGCSSLRSVANCRPADCPASPSGTSQPHVADEVSRTHGLIHDCPKLVALRTFPTIAVGGDLPVPLP